MAETLAQIMASADEPKSHYLSAVVDFIFVRFTSKTSLGVAFGLAVEGLPYPL
jgi:hypothetical protein